MNLKKDFPMLNKTIYLDNAASSLTPTPVVKATEEYYKLYRANVHRGLYKEAEKATKEYELAREKVARFINASPEEITFTSGTTASINLLAYSLSKALKEGDEILLSQLEHHSNLVPWQQLAKEKKLILKFIKVKDFQLDMEDFKNALSEKTKIISIAYVSNVLGTIAPVEQIAIEAKKYNPIIVVDAAQAVGHIPIDIKKLNCDFLCFSGHKMLGPTGIGIMYGKKEKLEKISPFLYGGSMIKSVSFSKTEFADLPYKFEAGTPNISGAIGLAAAIDYLTAIGIKNITHTETELTSYALKKLSALHNVELYGLTNAPEQRTSVISFNIKNIHSHDIAHILAGQNIAIRAGHMCAMPLVQEVLKQQAVCRISFSFYNTHRDIDYLITALKKIQNKLK